MASTTSRIRFFFDSLRKRIARTGNLCPSCQLPGTEILDRKYGVLRLERCPACKVLFRTPTTSPAESARYYQKAYTHGFTTEMPSDTELAELQARKFVGTGKDFSERIATLRALGVPPSARVLDYGCSWGYGTWQLRDAGFDAIGFEVSRPRAEYARTRMLVPVVDNPWAAPAQFDVVYSSHVIEHVPDPAALLQSALAALRPGGLWVSFCPNGSLDFRKAAPLGWHQLWGLDHPFFPDEVFFSFQAGGNPCFVATTPCSAESLARWAAEGASVQAASLPGSEILVVIRKPHQ